MNDMNRFLYSVGLLAILLTSLSVFSALEYRLSNVAPGLGIFSPVNVKKIYDCWIFDKSAYVFDHKLSGVVTRSCGALDHRDVLEGMWRNICNERPVALRLNVYDDPTFFEACGKPLIISCNKYLHIKHLVLDGPSFDSVSIGSVVLQLCPQLGEAQCFETISVPVGPFFSFLHQKEPACAKPRFSVVSASSYSCIDNTDDDLPFASPRCESSFGVSSMRSRTSSAGSSVAVGRRASDGSEFSAAVFRPKSIADEVRSNNKLCASGGSAFMTFYMAAQDTKDFAEGYKISGLKLSFIFPKNLESQWRGFGARSLSEKLFGFMVISAGSVRRDIDYPAQYFSQDDKSPIPVTLESFNHRIEVECSFEGEGAPFLKCSLSALDERLSGKFLKFLGIIVPKDLLENEKLWGYLPEASFVPIAGDEFFDCADFEDLSTK